MRRKGTRLLSLLTAAALCASILVVPASAAPDGVTVWSSTIGGKNASLVSISMQGRTGEISLANNSVVESVSAKTLIDNKNAQANTHVVAAINGGFFNSYTSKPWSFPSKCPQVMDGVVVNGKLIHTGRSATLGFSPDGKAMVDWVEFGSVVHLGNGSAVGSGWGVNTYHSEPGAIMLFNEHLTLPVTIPASSTMVFIQNKKVTRIMAGEKLWVPKGVDVLVYNSAAAELYKSWGLFPEVDMPAEIALTASGTSRDAAWAEVQSALTGGPVLVKDGENVVNDARNNSFYSDSKQKPTVVLARSFVGVTANGGLVMGTVTASFTQIADWMVKNGVREGIAMDGGGSCTLYAEGSGFLASGRDLAAALVIVDRTGSGGLPAESNMRAANADVPSGWAAEDIKTAISLGLVPQSVQGNYNANITRRDFCLLIWELMKKQPNCIGMLYSKPEVTFPDVSKDELLWVARLGIVNGYNDGTFKQYNLLTRAEAAKILAVTAQLLGEEDTREQFAFTDRGAFATWSVPYIDYCGVHGILKGTGGGRFNPSGNFTRQEAIVTILRIYQQYGSK